MARKCFIYTYTFHIACDKVNDDDGECTYLCCGICDLCSRLVDLFFSFIACLVHHDHCLPLSLNSHLFQCVKQKMNFLNFLHRLKMAHFIFVFILAAAAVVIVIAAVLWKRDLFVYSSSSFFRGLLSLWPQGLCVADSFFRAEVSAQKYAICLTEQKRCDSHTIMLTLSADDYYSSFIWCSLFLIYVLSLLI